jgi:hypothetical protein
LIFVTLWDSSQTLGDLTVRGCGILTIKLTYILLLVAITRCQALLIIVGDPRVLSLDPLWRSFLNYVYKNGGWKGPRPDWNTEAEVDLAGGYDKAISQQAEVDMNEFTRRMESAMMDEMDDGVTGVHLREE